MDHEGYEGPCEVDRRSFLGLGAVVAGGLGVTTLGSGRAADSGTDAFLGEILAVPYNFAPRNFMFCEGQTLPISQNQSLYSLLGNNYGGDGRTTFNLPDTRRLEDSMARSTGGRRPPFRYVIAISGVFPNRA